MTDTADPDDQITFALIHGGGDVGWAWHLVEAELRAAGHRTVAIDLPADDGRSGLAEQAAAVIEAVGDAPRVVVACHSFGGFTGPLVAAALPAAFLLVLVAATVPRPGEAPSAWWSASGYSAATTTADPGDDVATYYHDLDPALAKEALSRGRAGETRGLDEPWPLAAWPDVPTRHVLFRQDRVFPADFMRTMVRERLGITPDELDGSHGAMLSRPKELADYLLAAARDAPGLVADSGRDHSAP